ncbi:MAG: nickel pincer cofactor biosynthesis protein LarC [Caldilineaceae bacterium]|nr:nickel pincer cofactor biosynthesis protein LarC [Caldilineaceae bacterium]
MPTLAYLDTPSGISGDIFLGCLVDAGWPVERLRAVVESLYMPAESWDVRAEEVMCGPLRATLLHVNVAEGDAHRHLSDVRAIIEAGNLPTLVKKRAIAVFTRLAEAEAKVHGSSVDEVHFHEVGALDAIVDIVGVCAGLYELKIGQLHASPLPLGHGWANTMHGKIPLPAPATLELLAAANAPTRPAPGPGELVTPTGAALLAELALFSQPTMRLERIGLGAGQKQFEWPNVARLWLGEPLDAARTPLTIGADQPVEAVEVVALETNIDNMAPELYGAVSDRLFAAGALDVWTTPIGMKKNRPAILLSVLAPTDLEDALATLLLRETTTLGVRVQTLRRHVARRAIRTVRTVYGEARVKLKWVGAEVVGASPEYEDCRRLADAADVPIRLVYDAVHAAGNREFVQAGEEVREGRSEGERVLPNP